MKTRISLNRNWKKWEVRFLSFVAILAMAFPAMGSATAQAPEPWFTVFLEQGVVEGWNWPLGAAMHLSIDDPATQTSPDLAQDGTMEPIPWDPDSGGTWLWIDFSGAYEAKPGDVVTLTDGTTPKTHIVQHVSITAIDPFENTVTGTADAGKTVTLWSWEDPQGRRIETDGSANWTVDFNDIGFDLQPGFHVRAEVWDDGNDTAADKEVKNPHFTVFPEWEFFDGLDWPDGAMVTITVAGKPECTTSKESWGYFFNGNFGEGCDINFGDVVTFTDGTITRTHTVRTISVTTVDAENDLVKGIAEARAEVHVWPHATGQEQLAITNSKGKWNASFDGVYDLKPGEDGRAQVFDEVGNATAVDWHVPKPRIVASITEDWLYLNEFSPNMAMKISIFESQDEERIWTGTATTDGSGFAWINADGRWDLEPGNYIIVKDKVNQKELVIEGFTFDVFNLSTGQLTGTAPQPYGRNVWVGIGWENDSWSMEVTTDESGAWFANFGQPVPGDYQWVAAQIFDKDGDAIELRPSAVIY
jgi:hypothetical protein